MVPDGDPQGSGGKLCSLGLSGAHYGLTMGSMCADCALTVLRCHDWGAQASFVFRNTHMSNVAHSVWILTRISLRLSHPTQAMP